MDNLEQDEDEDMVSHEGGKGNVAAAEIASEHAEKSKGSKSNTRSRSNGNGDNVDSSTDSTSEGKSTSGSRSGEGYSADCSASDQSSDEGVNKQGTSSAEEGTSTDLTGLNRPGIKDKDEKVSRVSAGEQLSSLPVDGQGGATSSGDDPEEATKRVMSKRHHHSNHHQNQHQNQHHHHHHHKSTWAKATSRPAHEEVGDTEEDQEDDDEDSSVGIPIKFSDLLYLDSIVKDKARRKEENDEFLQSSLHLAQCKEKPAGNPINPLIDLSSVSLLRSSVETHAFPGMVPNPHIRQQDQRQQQAVTYVPYQSSSAKSVPSIDCYARLMELVQPFYNSHGIPFTDSRQLSQNDTSEGFSSFLPRPNQGSEEGSLHQQREPAQQSLADGETKEAKAVDDNQSDSSSLVVLARVKRKHLKGNVEEKSAAEDWGERGVRNAEKQGSPMAEDDDDTETSKPDPKQSAVASTAAEEPTNAASENPESSESSTSAVRFGSRGQVTVAAHHQGAAGGAGGFRHLHNHHQHMPTRIVTDLSSSNPTDTGGPSQTSSGAGSSGNTGSGSNLGTSSGSGNETKGSSEEGGKGSSEEGGGKGGGGSSEEGKGEVGSSEELAQLGNSPVEEGSEDMSDRKNNWAAAPKISDHHHYPHHHTHYHHHHHHEPATSPGVGGSDGPELDHGTNLKEAERERKLFDKKRKRIEMRREYEAQQHIESSESSHPKPEMLLRPGKPVTFDQALQFSKIPRLIIQSAPPFLVVHANAAFTRLTGIDSHKVVGRTVGSVLSLPRQQDPVELPPVDRNSLFSESMSHETSLNKNAHRPEGSGRAMDSEHIHDGSRLRQLNSSQQASLERLVAASGFGRFQFVEVVSINTQIVGKSVSFLKEDPDPSSCAAPEPGLSGISSSTVADMGTMAAGVAAAQREPKNCRDQSLSSDSTVVLSQPPVTRRILCRASIAPIVSNLELLNAQDEENNNDLKRRKVQAATDSLGKRTSGKAEHEEVDLKRRKMSTGETWGARKGGKEQKQVVSHYIIQLESEGDRNQGSVASLSSSSTSVEAHLLGISKVDASHQREVVKDAHDTSAESSTVLGDEDGAGSESTPSSSSSTREPLATVG